MDIEDSIREIVQEELADYDIDQKVIDAVQSELPNCTYDEVKNCLRDNPHLIEKALEFQFDRIMDKIVNDPSFKDTVMNIVRKNLLDH
jgi:uncharacterized protein (DUF2267 family)